MCPDLLIAGAFHIGNLGDDAIALAEREFFKNKGWQVKIARVAEGYDLIRNVDAIVLGGGGIIYDTSIANVHNSIIKLYKLGEPVYCFSHDDLEWLRTFTNPIQASNIIELSEKIDVNYMIISRFHALILSIMKEVTPIVLTGRMDYSTKVSCFLNRFPMKNVIEWTQPDIFQRLEALKSNPFLEDSKQLNSITCICKERALKAINLVDNVLKEGLK